MTLFVGGGIDVDLGDTHVRIIEMLTDPIRTDEYVVPHLSLP
jgi:hypothetical protein